MQKVIALDIGSYSIKAVEILNTFKSYEITNFYEKVIPYENESNAGTLTPLCMEQLFSENNLDADRIVTAMPGQLVSSRILSFNFVDPRKVATAILSSVEEVVPFDLDDMIVDHQIMGSFDKQTLALVVMTKKSFLGNFLDLLHRINIDPKLVDIDSLAFYNLSPFMGIDPDQCFAMIDIGHEKTSICIFKNGLLRMFRSINLGGRYITEFLARDLEVDFLKAQQTKHRVSKVLYSGYDGKDLSKEDYFIAERITLASNSIIKELGRTIYSFKNWDKAPLANVFISGGTSLIKNFDKLINEQLESPTTRCDLGNSDLKISPELDSVMGVMPQSVAIGLRTVSSVKKQSMINLRKGEFAYVQNYEMLAKVGLQSLKAIGFVAVLLILSYGIKYYVYQKNINSLQERYTTEYNQMFPEAGRKKTPKINDFKKFSQDSEKKLQQEINDMGFGVKNFADSNTVSPSLVVLRELSKTIPKEVKVDFVTFDFNTAETGDKQFTLTAETEGYTLQSQVIEAVKKVSVLKDVKEREGSTSQKPGTGGKIIKFVITATYNDSVKVN